MLSMFSVQAPPPSLVITPEEEEEGPEGAWQLVSREEGSVEERIYDLAKIIEPVEADCDGVDGVLRYEICAAKVQGVLSRPLPPLRLVELEWGDTTEATNIFLCHHQLGSRRPLWQRGKISARIAKEQQAARKILDSFFLDNMVDEAVHHIELTTGRPMEVVPRAHRTEVVADQDVLIQWGGLVVVSDEKPGPTIDLRLAASRRAQERTWSVTATWQRHPEIHCLTACRYRDKPSILHFFTTPLSSYSIKVEGREIRYCEQLSRDVCRLAPPRANVVCNGTLIATETKGRGPKEMLRYLLRSLYGLTGSPTLTSFLSRFVDQTARGASLDEGARLLKHIKGERLFESCTPSLQKERVELQWSAAERSLVIEQKGRLFPIPDAEVLVEEAFFTVVTRIDPTTWIAKTYSFVN